MNDDYWYILDDAGEPVPAENLDAYMDWRATHDVHIAEDYVGEVHVSTVFLGSDHNHMGRHYPNDPNFLPLWFETMIFGGANDEYQRRYSTRQEAMAGHQRAVQVASGEVSEEEAP